MRDTDASAVITVLKHRRAPRDAELLAWKDAGGWREVHNEYLRDVSGLPVTAKDFRTWHGTVLMALALAAAPPARSARRRAASVREAYRQVAEHLGNTPAVAKSSYVDPRVVDRYGDGETLRSGTRRLPDAASVGVDGGARRLVELGVLRLLDSGGRSR